MNLKQLEWILSKGIDVNLFTCLELIKMGEKIESLDMKVKGWIILLEKHELITSQGCITEKGEMYLAEVAAIVDKKDSFNMDVWTTELHGKLKARLLKLTQSEQVRPKIHGKTYTFLCNETDLSKKLTDFSKKYRNKNFIKIEKTLLNYIDRCHKENQWFPLMEYYIMKDGYSKLATDMQSVEQIVKEDELVNVKDIF